VAWGIIIISKQVWLETCKSIALCIETINPPYIKQKKCCIIGLTNSGAPSPRHWRQTNRETDGHCRHLKPPSIRWGGCFKTIQPFCVICLQEYHKLVLHRAAPYDDHYHTNRRVSDTCTEYGSPCAMRWLDEGHRLPCMTCRSTGSAGAGRSASDAT